jgi:hypothetical protein
VNLGLNYHENGNKSLKFWHNRLGHLYYDIILTLHNVLFQASSSCPLDGHISLPTNIPPIPIRGYIQVPSPLPQVAALSWSFKNCN